MKLATGLLGFSAGLRREIISLLRIDFLQTQLNEDNKQILVTKLQREKITRSNSSNIPLANQFLLYVQIFISQIRNALLKQDSPKDMRCLWINRKGRPMEKSNFTEVIRSVCAQFNPVLDITPIQFRRFNVTMVFQDKLFKRSS